MAGGINARSDLLEVVNEGDIRDHLPRASLFVTFYSSSAYDALIAGIPVVLLDWVSRHYRFAAEKYGAAVSIEDPSNLESVLRRVLFDQTARADIYRGGEELIRDHLFRLDGQASKRIATTIAGLIGDEKRRRNGS
jgi:hypothetical protein